MEKRSGNTYVFPDLCLNKVFFTSKLKFSFRSLNHNLATILDIEALTRIQDALALEGEPLFTFRCSTFHFFEACRAIAIAVKTSE